MGLTLAEKNHWKERISRKLDRAIEHLLLSKDPMFMSRIAKEARERAIKQLGIEVPFKRVEEIKETIMALERERILLLDHMEIALIPSAQFSRSYYDATGRVENAIKVQQAICELDLMNDTVLGSEIQKLRREQEELLDTVWLATSSAQITKLWGRVIGLLAEPPTDLQRETMQVLDTAPQEAE